MHSLRECRPSGEHRTSEVLQGFPAASVIAFPAIDDCNERSSVCENHARLRRIFVKTTPVCRARPPRVRMAPATSASLEAKDAPSTSSQWRVTARRMLSDTRTPSAAAVSLSRASSSALSRTLLAIKGTTVLHSNAYCITARSSGAPRAFGDAVKVLSAAVMYP